MDDLEVRLPLDASEPRLVPSPNPSAEPAMNAAIATNASSTPNADVRVAMGAVQKVHGAVMSLAAAILMARLEQKTQYSRRSLDCQYCHLQSSPDGESNINGDVLVKVRGNGRDGLNGIPVTLCQVVRGPGGSLNVREQCHLSIPVALL